VQGTDARAFVAGGRAMQQVWLTATALGLAVHPMNGLRRAAGPRGAA
jgi:nitroreductase